METKILAAYAANLSYNEIPTNIIERSKDCFIDSFGAAIYGADLPWSRMLIAYARRYSNGGNSSILGCGNGKVHAPFAALVNGALTHSFELDNVRQPGAGVHAGATLIPAGLAVAEEQGVRGTELLVAFVAGFGSHFLLDAIPHWDYHLASATKDEADSLNDDMTIGRQFVADLGKIGLDLVVGLALVWWLFASGADGFQWSIWFGAAGGVLPDLLQFVYFKFRPAPLRPLQRFHQFIHTKKRLDGRPALRIFLQIIIPFALILILWH